MLTRSITGLIFVLAILGSMMAGPQTYSVLLGIITVAAVSECLSLSLSGIRFDRWEKTIVCAVALAMYASGVAAFIADYKYLAIAIVIFILLLIYYLTRIDLVAGRVTNSVFAVAYVLIPMLSMIKLAFVNGQYSYHLPLLLFILIWINDTGAYLVGVSMGRHRLCERLSPKKSVEGFVGGLLFATIFGCFLPNLLLGRGFSISANGAVLGLLTSVFGTVGDLFESYLKRSAGVKDSGRILPGHGGILDRFDSLFFVAPVAVLFVYLIMY